MRRMTRREMLKLSALGLGSLAFSFPDSLQTIDLTSPKRLPVFPVHRALDG